MIGGIFGAIFRFILERIFGKRRADPATEAATAQAELKQEEAANEILRKGTDARTRVERDVMLGDNGAPGAVNTDPDAAVNKSGNAHFRD